MSHYKGAYQRQNRHYVMQYAGVRLRRNFQFGGIIARTRRLGDENVKFRKSNMADGRHFEKSLYLHISAANCPNFTKLSTQTQISSQAMEMWQKSEIPKLKMADGRHIESHFLLITRLHRVRLRRNLVYGGIIARHEGSWWKCPISKIHHGRRPPFLKSLYLHISAANRPNCTKFSMQTQILPQATEKTKNQKFANSKWRMDAALKITFWL